MSKLPDCNFGNDKEYYAYVAGDQALGYAGKTAFAWSCLMFSTVLSCILSIPAGLSISNNGLSNPTTITLIVILLSIMSQMVRYYMEMTKTPDGYTTECNKRPIPTIIVDGKK